MGLLQLGLDSEQALLTASDEDKVAPQGSMQAGISFAEPTGSPRDEGGLSVIHTMVKRGFFAPQSSLLFALKMGRSAREINQLLYKALQRYAKVVRFSCARKFISMRREDIFPPHESSFSSAGKCFSLPREEASSSDKRRAPTGYQPRPLPMNGSGDYLPAALRLRRLAIS